MALNLSRNFSFHVDTSPDQNSRARTAEHYHLKHVRRLRPEPPLPGSTRFWNQNIIDHGLVQILVILDQALLALNLLVLYIFESVKLHAVFEISRFQFSDTLHYVTLWNCVFPNWRYMWLMVCLNREVRDKKGVSEKLNWVNKKLHQYICVGSVQ